MNIFELYLKKIQDLIIVNSNNLKIDSNLSFKGAVVETPPLEFNFDLSSNIALVLAKKTKQEPLKLAESLKKLIIENLNDFSEVSIAGPGFINFKFTTEIYIKLIFNILESNKDYGSNNKNYVLKTNIH